MHARAPTQLAGQFGAPAIPAAPPLLRAIRIALFSAVLAIAGVVLSVGWLLHLDALRRWGPDWPAMVPSSATCLLALSSGHLAFLVHPGQRTADLLKAACLVSAALAGGNAAIMIGGAETGLDRVLWPGALAQPRDGMSPAATICALLATAASFIISLQRPGDRMPAHAS